jgi:hypothetical protein
LHSWALKTCKFVKIPRSILQNHNISSYRVYVKKCTFDRIINMITNVCTQNYKYGDDDNFLDVIWNLKVEFVYISVKYLRN